MASQAWLPELARVRDWSHNKLNQHIFIRIASPPSHYAKVTLYILPQFQLKNLIFSQGSFTNYVSTISQIFSLSCHQFLGRECPYFLNFFVPMNFKLFAEFPFFKKKAKCSLVLKIPFSLHVLVKLGKNPACRSLVLQKNIQLNNARKTNLDEKYQQKQFLLKTGTVYPRNTSHWLCFSICV